MVDRLRLFLNRPLRDGDRPRLFALGVAVIIAAAAAFALLDDAGPAPERRARTDGSPVAAPVAGPVEAPAPRVVALEAPSEEGQPPAALEVSRADVRAAKGAARRFLAGYVPYTYGRGSARPIARATPELRRRLERERPRVPVRERRRRPRVLLVQADGVGRRRAGMVGLVSDGRRRYAVPLELARTAAGWRVTDVGA